MNAAMTQLNAMLNQTVPATAVFPPTSRYSGLATAMLVLPNGREVIYLRRRVVPDPSDFTTVAVHRVKAADRPDLLAGNYLGDPEQFWQICDANGVMRPQELTQTPDSLVRITLGRGIKPSAIGTAS